MRRLTSSLSLIATACLSAQLSEPEAALSGAPAAEEPSPVARPRMEEGLKRPAPARATRDVVDGEMDGPAVTVMRGAPRKDAHADAYDEAVPERPAPRQELPLKAGMTDDNASFSAFLEFLGTWTDRDDMRGRFEVLDVRDPVQVWVKDAAGVPVAGARVAWRVDGAEVLRASTYGDGRAPLHPHLASGGGASGDARPEIVVRHGDEVVKVAWTGQPEVDVTLAGTTALPAAVPVDVAFVLDTTGSMSDEIDRIKQTLLTVVAELDGLSRPVDLRMGAVLYRDQGDEYVTRVHALTSDLTAFDRTLRGVSAGGGGDTPEDLNAALWRAVDGLQWRPGAARVAFVIADAPPHMDYDAPRYGGAATRAIAEGIRIHTVAASGLDAAGSLIFRQIAQLTQGRFVFIEYGGSVAGSAAAHGVNGEQIASNNLDRILFERIREEVDGWRR